MDRDAAISGIKGALRRRSKTAWSVTGGKGTAWGWLRISAPPSRRSRDFGHMTPNDCEALGALLGLGRPAHPQGEMVPSSNAFYQEYMDRANGNTPSVKGTAYWD